LIISLRSTLPQKESQFIDHHNDHYILGTSSYKDSVIITNQNLLLSELITYFKASFNLNKNVVVYKDEKAFEKNKGHINVESNDHVFFEKRYKGLLQIDMDGPVNFDYLKNFNKNY
jgi:hypothetical protein